MNDSSVLAPDAPLAAPDAAQDALLAALLQRMRDQSDFPALSEAVSRILCMATSERESVGSVTNEILKDVALTNKLLRLVNSAHYARGNSVGTVSRAVSLVGFNGIRNMALSLVLLDHMQDKANAQLLREEFLRALMAGSIASELGATQAEGEEAFIGALFQNLGRMLTQFYFPEEAARIRGLVSTTHDPVSEELASRRVLGLGFEALGLGVSKAWGMPESIQRCIVKPMGEPPMHPVKDALGNLRWAVRAANEMADAILHADAAVVDVRLAQVGKRYAKSLGLSLDQLQRTTVLAREKLTELAQAMEITVPPDSLAAKLLTSSSDAVKPPDAASSTFGEAMRVSELHATAAAQTHSAAPPELDEAGVNVTLAEADQVAQTLTEGIQDITNAMVDDFRLSDILRMVLEAMLRALDFHRVVFCLRDPRTDMLTGRFGLGADVEGVVKTFCVPLAPSSAPDLFATICSKGADTLISDTSDPRIAARLPAWYQRAYHAPTFLILPLLLKGKPIGLIYADKANKSTLKLSQRELSLLRTLRSQAVMAFKQSS